LRLDLRLEIVLAEALYWTDVARAVGIADNAAQRAAAGDEGDAALACTVAALTRFCTGECSSHELERLARQALPLLEAVGDDDGLVHVWYALAWAANGRQRYEDWAQAMENALRHRRLVHSSVPGWLAMMLAVPLAQGPRPASEALATLDAAFGEHPYAGVLLLRGVLLAMLDHVDEAWSVALPAEERLREFGLASTGEWLGELAIVVGDYEAANRHLRDACDALEAIGNLPEISTYAPLRGRALCKLGRHDEAEPLAQRGRELGDPEDNMTQTLWRQTQALVHSARGQHGEAEQLARGAVTLSLRSDSPLNQGLALTDLAEVLESAGRGEEAATVLREALACYERKPIIPLARRTRERLAALEAVTPS
jgi:tetratricopeptide (TPR) repeat protein